MLYKLRVNIPLYQHLLWNARKHKKHCAKCVCIRSISDPYSVNLRIQYECGEVRTRKTLNTETFYTVREALVRHGLGVIHKVRMLGGVEGWSS